MNKKSTVAEDIAKKLESMILDGILELGDKLPAERMLAEKLGVSRPSLREAKQILVSKGLLETTQGGGTYVKRTL
ncbi:MAG: FadR family transcriptional regulator, partial [Candidatus Thioglobus sp.]|nr:FadR family transcriptional regulator [Candidatus Thioglobus sp.]